MLTFSLFCDIIIRFAYNDYSEYYERNRATRFLLRRSGINMSFDAIDNNDIVLPNDMGRILKKKASTYYDKTAKIRKLDNRVQDFIIPNGIDMKDM